jgi:hypothetical protein
VSIEESVSALSASSSEFNSARASSFHVSLIFMNARSALFGAVVHFPKQQNPRLRSKGFDTSSPSISVSRALQVATCLCVTIEDGGNLHLHGWFFHSFSCSFGQRLDFWQFLDLARAFAGFVPKFCEVLSLSRSALLVLLRLPSTLLNF